MIGIQAESEFDRIIRDAEFSYQLMEQNREMERFVNESIILASGNRSAINEMAIINEAAAGDKIKSFFEKIKNFFKKIFDKLAASMSALFKEQKDYVEKYAKILTKCKWNCGDVTDVYDIFVGLPRIIDVVDTGDEAIFGPNSTNYLTGEDTSNPEMKDENAKFNYKNFTSEQNVKDALANAKANPVDATKERTAAFERYIKSGYWANQTDFASSRQNDSNGAVSPGDTFKAWFMGSADTTSYDGNKIEENFRTCINVCYAGQSYINKLEKIVTTVNKKMDDVSKAVENYNKAQKEKLMTFAKQEGGNTKKLTVSIAHNDKDGYVVTSTLPADMTTDKKDVAANILKNANLDTLKAEVKNHIDTKYHNTITFSEPAEEAKPDNPNNTGETKVTFATYRSGDQTNGWSYDDTAANLTGDNKPVVKIDASDATKISEDEFKKKVSDQYNGKKDKDGKKIVLESTFNLYRDYKNFFNEDFGSTSSSSKDDTSNTSAKNSLNGSGAAQVTKAGETNTALGNKAVGSASTNDNLDVAGGVSKEIDEFITLDIKRRETIINANVNISTTLATQMFNAFKYINDQCFKAVKAHVQWYLSNPGAEDQAENQTTRARSLDMNVLGSANKPTTTTTNNA